MRFLSVRELRNRPGAVWEQLRDDDLVITVDGKPAGLLLPVSDESLEQTCLDVRRARALSAVSRMRRHAAESDRSRMSEEEIEAEIRSARREARS
jgi:prevent-host-death family protein